MATYLTHRRCFSRNARLFLATAVAAGFSSSAFLLFFNLYVLSLGYGKELLGWLQAMPAISGLVAALPAGLLADRFGRKPVLLAGTFLSGLAGLGFLLATTPGLMLLAMAWVGVGGALYLINIEPFLSESANDEERTALFSVHFGLITLTTFLGALVAGQLPGLLSGWLGVGPESPEAYRAALFVGGTPGIIGLIPLLLIHERRGRAHHDPISDLLHSAGEASPTRNSPGLKALLRAFWPTRTTLHLAIPNLMIALGATLLIPYLNVFFKERYSLPDNWLGGLFGLEAVVGGLAVFVGPAAARRWGKVRSVAAGQISSIVFLLVLGFVPVLAVAAVAFLVRAMLMFTTRPLYTAFSMEQTPPRERGQVNAVLSLAWGLGSAIGPGISGLVQARWGFGPLFLATGILYLAAALWVLVSFYQAEPIHRRPSVVRQ